jgi:DNA (cytosine-5)-methyltransferase 1
MRTVAFCEIDPFCRRVLGKHWPGIPAHHDVRELRGNDVGPVDLICGGYPCQPFSIAGKRAGEADDRHLWPEYRRLVEELRPAWVIGENVAGHISMGLDSVLSDLDALGYSSRPFVIPACAVDARHRRDRIWIVAYRDPGQRLQPIDPLQAGRATAGDGGQALADAERERGRRGNAEREDAEDAWQSPGDPGFRTWDSEPDVGRVANGVPARVDRLRALGNAVVPQVAERIGRAIMSAYGTYGDKGSS